MAARTQPARYRELAAPRGVPPRDPAAAGNEQNLRQKPCAKGRFYFMEVDTRITQWDSPVKWVALFRKSVCIGKRDIGDWDPTHPWSLVEFVLSKSWWFVVSSSWNTLQPVPCQYDSRSPEFSQAARHEEYSSLRGARELNQGLLGIICYGPLSKERATAYFPSG